MKLTFKGFLRNYCRQLSGLETDSLRKLCRQAAEDAPRVAEPLFLFALEQNKLPYLLKLSKGTWMEREYRRVAEIAATHTDAATLLEDPDIPMRYRKVRQAYQAQRDTIETDRRITALMREKTLAGLNARGMTPYRLCVELDLNLGNVYAYLNRGDVSKVSRETARRIMEFALS